MICDDCKFFNTAYRDNYKCDDKRTYMQCHITLENSNIMVMHSEGKVKDKLKMAMIALLDSFYLLMSGIYLYFIKDCHGLKLF